MGLPQTDPDGTLLAAAIARECLGYAPRRLTRYRTGFCHRVFEVEKPDGTLEVLRVTGPENMAYHHGCLFWNPKLAALGIPAQSVLKSGSYGEFRYVLLSHLPGRDLGEAYATLSDAEKRGLAEEIAGLQRKASSLRSPGGFGWTFGNGPGGAESWDRYLDGEVEIQAGRVAANGVFEASAGERVRGALSRFRPYFCGVASRVFLDDTTTKNVLVHNGKLSGIVDVDGVTLGDGLLPLGLTKMALLNLGRDTRYIDYWLEARGADPAEREIVDVYALFYCFVFMAETGGRFENGAQVPAAESTVRRLREIFAALSENLTKGISCRF